MKKLKKEEKLRRNKPLKVDGFFKGIIFFFAAVLISLIVSYNYYRPTEFKVNVILGEPATKDIYSPLSFSFIDKKKTESLRKEAAKKIADVYHIDDSVTKTVFSDLDKFFEEIDKIKATEGNITDVIARSGISAENLNVLLKRDDLIEFKKNVRETLAEMLAGGVISFSKKIELLRENKRYLVLKANSGEVKKDIFSISSDRGLKDELYKISVSKFPDDKALRGAFIEIVSNYLRPNLVYDKVETEKRKKLAEERVEPVSVNVMKNEIILRRGDIVTDVLLDKISELQKKLAKQKVLAGALGAGIVSFLYIFILALFLYSFERKIFNDVKNITFLNTILITNLLINRILLSFADANKFLLPASFAALVTAILVKPRVGFIMAIGMALLSGIMIGYDPYIMITTILSSAFGLYMILDVRKREQFFIVGAVIAITNSILIFSFSLSQGATLYDSLLSVRTGVGNGFLITMMLFPGIWIFENIFDFTTPITLLELSDLNHPLLKRLSIEAPGTYHHSLVVSNLAESAAEAIGANSLLARVGSYFHDIGKMEKPEYFTENQTSKEKNIHDELSPRMSYFIIANHVKDGVELAKKYKLRNIIIDFIMQHHGTSVVYYFYKKALEQEGENSKLNVDDYRYPGPKPQSKEIAITLLADSVEAASRSLSDPTPSSIRGVVEKVVNNKFLDNQLDECELTLLDLHKIKESFIRNLMASFHTRIEYPDMPGIKNEKNGKNKR